MHLILCEGVQKATHQWACVLRAPNDEDQSYYIRKVVFQLHPSFTLCQRTVEKPPFEVLECGWGEFDISLRIHFVDQSEKPIDLQHTVRLYPIPSDDDTCQKRYPPTEAKACLAAETHDELIFNEPHENFYRTLIRGPTKPPIVYNLKAYFLDRDALLAKFASDAAAGMLVVSKEIEEAKSEIAKLTRDVEDARDLYQQAYAGMLEQCAPRQPVPQVEHFSVHAADQKVNQVGVKGQRVAPLEHM